MKSLEITQPAAAGLLWRIGHAKSVLIEMPPTHPKRAGLSRLLALRRAEMEASSSGVGGGVLAGWRSFTSKEDARGWISSAVKKLH